MVVVGENEIANVKRQGIIRMFAAEKANIIIDHVCLMNIFNML